MAVTALNHVTIAVSDLERSFGFYLEMLGFRPHARWGGGAYLTLGDMWFCLSVDEAKPALDYSHLAFSVAEADFASLRNKLLAAGVPEWKRNRSEGDSFYFLDPDGHKLELHVGTLESRLAHVRSSSATDIHFF